MSENRSKSEQLLQRAQKHMPLGVADNYRYWGEQETVFIQSAKGEKLLDVNGQSYTDFRLAYGPIILGYRDQRIDNQVIDCIQNTATMTGFSTALDSDVIELIKKMCPSIEKVRFANSGTEAVMGALRCARSYTQKNKVVVVEGGFHGLNDEMMWKANIDDWDPMSDESPKVEAFGTGIPESTGEHVIYTSMNDVAAVAKIFSEHEDIAAVLIEPILGNCGSIEAEVEYLQALRRLCDERGALLIFDEVKTGFRVAKGGVQELYAVSADLTTYAKAMGNGYPIAVFGGRDEVMAKIGVSTDSAVHGGTYTANIIGLTAAKATLSVLSETDALESIDRTGEKIKGVIKAVFDELGVAVKFAGPNAMFGIHIGDIEPKNYRQWKRCDNRLYQAFATNLIKQGVMVEPDSREPWFICEAHKNTDLVWLGEQVKVAMTAALNDMSDIT